MYCAVLRHSVVFDSGAPLECPTRLCPWGFSRQECWSGLPCLPSGDVPNPEIKPRSPALQVDSLLSEPPGNPKYTRKCQKIDCRLIFHVQVSARVLLMTEKPNWRESLHKNKHSIPYEVSGEA